MAIWSWTMAVATLVVGVGLVRYYQHLPRCGEGWSAPAWQDVGRVFRDLISTGKETGGQFAAYYKGELVVDFHGGYADDDAYWKMESETLILVCSCNKAVAALVIAVMVDRGLLDYQQTVAHYWPEFAANGKEDITLHTLLSHQAGLAVSDVPYTVFDFIDKPDMVSEILANQTPVWPPGSQHGYHGFNLVPYINEIIKRVDPHKRSINKFFLEEIAVPEVIDFHYGVEDAASYRVARVYDFSLFEILFASRYWEVVWTFFTQPQSITTRSIVNPSGYDTSVNHPKFRNVPMNSYASAKGLAKLMGIFAQRNNHLLKPETIRHLKTPLVSGKDEVLRLNITYGPGFTLRKTPTNSWMVGAPGAGGQMAYFDPELELGWAYLTNHHSIYAIGDDPRYLALEKAMYDVALKLSV